MAVLSVEENSGRRWSLYSTARCDESEFATSGEARMKYATAIVILVFLFMLGTGASANDESSSTDGTVVAIQKGKHEVRMIDPDSVGDLVEVWMVRVDHWPRAQKPEFILVEYTHKRQRVGQHNLEI